MYYVYSLFRRTTPLFLLLECCRSNSLLSCLNHFGFHYFILLSLYLVHSPSPSFTWPMNSKRAKVGGAAQLTLCFYSPQVPFWYSGMKWLCSSQILTQIAVFVAWFVYPLFCNNNVFIELHPLYGAADTRFLPFAPVRKTSPSCACDHWAFAQFQWKRDDMRVS